MKKSFTQSIILLSLLIAGVQSMYAHDAWLEAKWDKTKTRVILTALVAEAFPDGEAIKDKTRFADLRVYDHVGKPIAFIADSSDSTVLGSPRTEDVKTDFVEHEHKH